jgi:3-dehydroquinate synthetase
VLRVMAHDKKIEHGHLRFVLPTHMGKCELVEAVNPDEVRAAIY